MRNLFKSPTDINRIEFWAATTVFVFSIFFLVSSSVGNRWSPYEYNFKEANQQFSYFLNYFLPTLVRNVTFYTTYCLLAFVIVPPLVKKDNLTLNIIFLTVIFGFVGLIMAVTDTWTEGHLFGSMSEDEVYNKLFQENVIYAFWLLMMYTLYNAIKILAIYLLENTDLVESKYRLLTRDGIYAFILWMIGLFIFMLANVQQEVIVIVATCSLAAILIYCYSQYTLLPEIFRRNKSFKTYFRRILGIVLLGTLPIIMFLLLVAPRHADELPFVAGFFNVCFQLLFTVPISWYVFKARMTVDYEIRGLQTALGRSNADLNFLRSQINPHFLFNVLNTLYGTALQENAERSAEGIQKLGDMMRFMLRENLQEKISLTREIEYLNNYIGLQTLRTQSSPDIAISTAIEDHTGTLQIAPMLLIPFIENAFKHGISLKDPSFIRISLVTKGNTLYFDVSNSIQAKSVNDPEKDNNGIGLNNVKQRLKLLYGGKHELSVRENGKEFFIHLTVDLS